MTTFLRTTTGKSAKHLFHPGQVLIWVEGDDDLSAYDWLIRGLDCRLEPAGGKSACLTLADALVKDDLAYVVVIDGDYDILKRRRSQHRRIVWLHRYSIENYFIEQESVNRLCDSLRRPIDGRADARFSEMIDRLESDLEEAVILDAAAIEAGLNETPLPRRIEPLLPNGRGCKLDTRAVEDCCQGTVAEIPPDTLSNVRRLVADWKERSRLAHLVRGHLIFGLLRQYVHDELLRRGHKWTADNRTFLILLCAEVWNGSLPADHRSLRRRLQRAVGDVRQMERAS